MVELDDNEPIGLDEACRVLFKNRIRPDTLRREAARGRLTIERIGRKDFVTPAAIREMRKKCEVALVPRDQDFGSNQPGFGRTERSHLPDGASGTTEDTNVALTSALQSVTALSKISRPTSPASTRSRRASLNLVPD